MSVDLLVCLWDGLKGCSLVKHIINKFPLVMCLGQNGLALDPLLLPWLLLAVAMATDPM